MNDNTHAPQPDPRDGLDHTPDTVSEDLSGETLDEPVLDGAMEHSEDDIDPRKGEEDPQLIRHPEIGKKTVAPYGE